MLKVFNFWKRHHTLVKSIHFSKGKFCKEFKYATNFFLDDKLKKENAEIKKNNNIQLSVPLYSKTIVHYSLVLMAHNVLNISDVV